MRTRIAPVVVAATTALLSGLVACGTGGGSGSSVPGDDAALLSLTVSSGKLTPAFSPATLVYTVGPALLPDTVTVTPTAAHEGATIRVDGVVVTSGQTSLPIHLDMGPRVVAIDVTGHSGGRKVYGVAFDRTSAALSALLPSTGSLSPAFEPGTFSYTVGPRYFPRTTTLTPTAVDPGATITVNDVATPTGEPSAYISFLPRPEPVTVEVTARDGVTTSTYTVVFDQRRFAYAVNSSSNDVTTFAIDGTTGALSEVGTEVPAGANPASIALDPSGRFAYVANYSSHNVTTFAIDPTTGTLTQVGSDAAAGSNPLSIAVDPSGRFAYVANFGSDNVTAFAIDGTTGALSEVGTEVAAGSGPYTIAVAPSGRAAYLTNFDSHNVTTYAIDATTGALTEVGTEVAAGTNPISITVEPSGRFAYVANYGSNNVTTFAIDGTTGALTEIGAEVAAGFGAHGITVDPSGRFAYVVNIYSNDVTTFARDASTGTLTEVGSPVVAGQSPISITVDPSGRFAYVANLNANSVTTFAIDGATGVLSAEGTAATGTNPRPIAILP